MAIEFRVLGPLEALVDGSAASLGGSRPRSVLAVLLLNAGQVVPASRLIDDIWGDDPPETAANVVQGYVSQLRKELGREAIETRAPGYVVRADHDALDLHRFERLASEGARALEHGRPEKARQTLREALALWRGPALADLADSRALQAAGSRLEELRVVAWERRAEADLALGRHAEIVAELEALVAEHPLRERPRALHMLALYRCGRQGDALAAYRRARSTFVEELGIEPGVALQELDRSILRHDAALDLPASAPAAQSMGSVGPILVAALDETALELLVSLAVPLARRPRRELVLAQTVSDAAALPAAVDRLGLHKERLQTGGITVRAAAFTSVTPGADLARLASDQDADLVLVDAPGRLLEDARMLTLLEDATCDVAVLAGGAGRGDAVVVPFSGAEHDWSAVELGAWFSLGADLPLVLLGSSAGGEGSDASRLLASASLAVQRTLGADATPLLVEPTAQALVAATRDSALVVVGLTDRWRREGVGSARTALATSPHHPTLLVRRGLRPGGLAPRRSDTRFTWTIADVADR